MGIHHTVVHILNVKIQQSPVPMTLARELQILAVLIALTGAARADEAVSVGGGLALLNKPANANGSVILIPGGDGNLGIEPNGSFSRLKGNQLVRTRKDYLKHGVATLTVDKGVDVAQAVTYMRSVASPVVVVATSRGSLRVPAALNAKPDGLVLTAAFLADVQSRIAVSALPRTLVVHHRQDGCHHTPPSAVAPFVTWSNGKATAHWVEGGTDAGDPCQAKGYHGFGGQDGTVVATIARFAKQARHSSISSPSLRPSSATSLAGKRTARLLPHFESRRSDGLQNNVAACSRGCQVELSNEEPVRI